MNDRYEIEKYFYVIIIYNLLQNNTCTYLVNIQKHLVQSIYIYIHINICYCTCEIKLIDYN